MAQSKNNKNDLPIKAEWDRYKRRVRLYRFLETRQIREGLCTFPSPTLGPLLIFPQIHAFLDPHNRT